FLNHENGKKVFPTGREGCDGACTPRNGPATSGIVKILPYLEYGALYDQFESEASSITTPSKIPGSISESVIGTIIPELRCPSSIDPETVASGGKQWGLSSYAMCAGHHGPTYGISRTTKDKNSGLFLYRDSLSPADTLDGLSHVFLVGEVTDAEKPGHTNRWAVAGRHVDTLRTADNPVNTGYQQGVTFSNYGNPCNGAFASQHPGGAVFALGDGSTHFMSENISLSLYRLLGQRASGKVKSLP
ncbi:MAG: DUF1559 domain-containing protein, partial [Pirellulales bacterium]